MNKYARNDQVRAHFYVQGVNIANPDPLYYPNLGVGQISQGLGDITNVEVPDPDRLGEFIVVDGIPGQRDRATTSFTTRSVVGSPSILSIMRQRGLVVDVHLNRGICRPPADPNSFEEKVILEGVRITNYSTSELVALSSDERSSTTESADVSIDNWYTIYQMKYGIAANPTQSATNNAPTGIVVAPSWCSGSLQCNVAFLSSRDRVFHVTGAGAVAYSSLAGVTFDATTKRIGGIGALTNRIAIAVEGEGIILSQYDNNGITFSTLHSIAGLTTVDSFKTNGRNGVLGSELNAITFNSSVSSVRTAAVSGIAGSGAVRLSDVDVSHDSEVYVAVSDVGYAMYSEDGETWKAGGNITLDTSTTATAIVALSKDAWIIGTSNGKMWLTSNAGVTYTQVLSTTGSVNDILWVTKHVLYAAIGSTLWRSTDGGASWVAEPNKQGGSFINVTSVNRLAVCPDDVNEIRMAGVTGGNIRMFTGTPG